MKQWSYTSHKISNKWTYISTMIKAKNGKYTVPFLAFLWAIYSPKIIKLWSLYISQIFKIYGFNIFHIFQKYGLLNANTPFLKPFKILLKRL